MQRLAPSTVIFAIAALALALAFRPAPAHAAGTLVISEVAPWSSGNSPASLAVDWFEVTNTGGAPVDISGWKMDDNSNSFAASVPLTGITSISPGESVIFLETNDLAGKAAAFRSLWWGSNPPAGLQIGAYNGSGVGLSTSGDAVNLFNGSGVLQANVSFGASTTSAPFRTFDNAAGLDGTTISTLSTLGVHAAFNAANDASELGSPGTVLNKLFVSEVAPWSSGNSPASLAVDWFEVTNTTPSVIDMSGWRIDDNSNSFAASVALTGITSIGPGESVIFLETNDLAGKAAAFRSLWWGATPPAGLQIGAYNGAGVGLSTSGDAVNLYNGAGVLQANVSFGGSPSVAPFATFNNAAGLTGPISQLSVINVDAAAAASDANEVGSPGTIRKPAASAPPPPPATVKINEINSAGAGADWIEIVNTGAATADVSGLKLLDSDNAHTKYSIPAGTSLPVGGVLAIDQAQFGFELDNVDSVRLFATDGATVLDSYNWTQSAPTSFGRCPDGSGAMTVTLAASHGGPNICLSSIASSPWPGGASVNSSVETYNFGTNLSGLAYEPSGTNAPGVLWAVQNGPSTMYRLIWTGTVWTPDTAHGWGAGKALRFPDGSGDPDSEGITFSPSGPAGGVYVSIERDNNNNGVSRPGVLLFDVSGDTTTLLATREWAMVSDLPVVGSNLGLEGVTFIPDSYLTAHGFVDESTGAAYNPLDYANHGGGIFFTGLEANGLIYAYALNHSDGSFHRVATIVTGFGGVMDLSFDRDRGDFWAVCDNTCNGRAELLTIDSSGRFEIAHLYERPTGLPNYNNEGFTVASEFECAGGLKPAFWSDDDNDGGIALRAGTVPCSFTAAATSLTYTGPTAVTLGDALAATVTSTGIPDGASVTFTFGTGGAAQTCTGTVASNAVACSITGVTQTVGPVALGVGYVGDFAHTPASTSGSVTVSAIPTSLSYTGATSVTLGTALAASAASTSIPDGASVTFTLGTGEAAQTCTGTVASNAVSCSITGVMQPAGPAPIAVTYAGDATHLDSSTVTSITVEKLRTTTTVTFGPGPFVYNGHPFVATATVLPGGSANITYGGDCTNVGTTCTATATFTGSTNYLGSTASTAIVIVMPSKDSCMNGGWQSFGVFKNQGDCVSWVATGGKNPPSPKE